MSVSLLMNRLSGAQKTLEGNMVLILDGWSDKSAHVRYVRLFYLLKDFNQVGVVTYWMFVLR